MEFNDVIKNRYSVRSYKNDDVEDEKLKMVLEAARLAPTAHNYQPFQLIVIKTAGREKELNHIYPAKFFTDAPIVICACAVPDEGWTRDDGKNYTEVDTTIAMDHIILTATSLGLGTCWIGKFNEKEARKILDIPENVVPLLFTPLGYPDIANHNREKKPIEELVRYDKW